jgi:hypothetical protein
MRLIHLKSVLNFVGILAVCLWLYFDPSWEALSVLLFSLAYVVHDQRGSVKQRQLEKAHPEFSGLVDHSFWRGHVNVTGAPTQNELLLLLLSRYPKWSSKFYLERSLMCRTQSLADALAELREGGSIIECCSFFTKLSKTGFSIAVERATKYGA